MKDVSDLYANIPVHAFAFEGKLAQSGELNVNMTVVGRFETSQTRVGVEDLEGNCATATHAIRAFIVGSFDFYAGASSEGKAGVTVGGFGASGSQSNEQTSLVHDGTPNACQSSGPSDHGPPFGCGALIRLELLPLGDAARVGEAPSDKTGALRNPYDAKHLTDLTSACDQGHARSCATLGEMYEGPIGVKFDATKAFSLYKKACDAGDPEGCGLLGRAYLDGVGAPQDVATGVNVLRGACEKNCGAACYFLADLYRQGTGVPVNIKRYEALMAQAFSLVKAECDGGDAGYCGWLGGMYLEGLGVPKNEERGQFYRKAACDAGLGSACRDVAGVLLKAAGDDDAQAASAYTLYDKACETGDGTACHAAGLAFWDASGDDHKFHGIQLLARACNMDIAKACFDAGDIIGNATNILKAPDGREVRLGDPAASAPLFAKACKLGDVEGCQALGEAGRLDLLGEACNLGQAEACRIAEQKKKYAQRVQQAQTAFANQAMAQQDQSCRSGLHVGTTVIPQPNVCSQLAFLHSSGVYQDPVKAREYSELACRGDSRGNFVNDCFKAARAYLGAGDRGKAGDLAAVACLSRNQSAGANVLADGCKMACGLGHQEACARQKLFEACMGSKPCKNNGECYPDRGMCCQGGMCGGPN
ncbi:MAG: tetratricopeptide repeat protein [Polyangiaceae bacterium]